MSRMSQPKRVLNVLLLGPTGIGKSTFVNAVANYFVRAQNQQEVVCLIPASFNHTDENYEEVLIQVGDQDENEVQDSGQTATQSCRAYQFVFEEFAVRLIDTPGMGDTRGTEQDKLNLDNILSFLKQYQVLHGICFFLRSNETRLTATFNFCIRLLFGQLSRDAGRNLMFVFTSSRGTSPQLCPTLPLLQQLIQDMNAPAGVPAINVHHDNCFFLDNEGFRYKLAASQGQSFSEEARHFYRESWSMSAHEIRRLFEYVARRPAYEVRRMKSVSEARRLIIELSRPLAAMVENIVENTMVRSYQMQAIKEHADQIDFLRDQLITPEIVIEPRSPQMVCMSNRCRRMSSIGSLNKYHYPQVCHSPCRIIIDRNPSKRCLFYCVAFDASDKCTKCGCPSGEHQQVTSTTVVSQIGQQDETLENWQSSMEETKRFVHEKCKTLQETINELHKELEQIQLIAATFGSYLQASALAQFSDALESQISILLAHQKELASPDSNNHAVISHLENFLKTYKDVKSCQAEGCAMLSPADIFDYKSQLYSLKFAGQTIRQMHQIQQATQEWLPHPEEVLLECTLQNLAPLQ